LSRASYILWRVAQIVPTVLMIGVVVFLLTRLLPGGPIAALLGDKASDEAIARVTAQYGFDQPIYVQFVKFLNLVIHGDLGESIAYRMSATRLIADRLPVTLTLTGMAIAIALILATPLAFVAALYQNRWPDLLIRGAFQVGLSSPIFYVGLLLLTFLAAGLHLFPVGGYGDTIGEKFYHLLLPALTLALSLSAIIMRSLRAAIIAVMGAEFILFARAKGLPASVVFRRHVLRNAIISTVTIIGLHAGDLLGGAVVTETVFAVPGVGRLMVDSIFARDYPVIQALTLTLAVIVSLTFLVADLVQMALDPRIAR
jgi:peptide/nickel transport system permease protein